MDEGRGVSAFITRPYSLYNCLLKEGDLLCPHQLDTYILTLHTFYTFRVPVRITLRSIVFANDDHISFTSAPVALSGGVQIKCRLCYNREI